MRLTEHFTLAEFVRSDTALRLGVDNTPPREIIDSLTHLASTLERVRLLLGAPLHISSGYRCPELNRAIGGSRQSAHMLGLAADFTATGFGDPRAIVRALAPRLADMNIDQLIFEGTWVHLAVPPWPTQGRHELLTAHFSANGTTYTRGLA